MAVELKAFSALQFTCVQLATEVGVCSPRHPAGLLRVRCMTMSEDNYQKAADTDLTWHFLYTDPHPALLEKELS